MYVATAKSIVGAIAETREQAANQFLDTFRDIQSCRVYEGRKGPTDKHVTILYNRGFAEFERE